VRAGHLPNEPTPVGVWTALNRVLLTLIVVTALAVIVYRFLPETARRKAQAEQVAVLSDTVEKQRQLIARAKREAELLTRDPALVELIARDKLDLKKDDEKVYRLDQDTPAPLGSTKRQEPRAR
jgi:cell division protein FtsB